MSACEYYIDLISAGIDGELSSEEEKALAEHLEHCEACRRLKDAFESVSGELSENLVDAPASLHENVMTAIRAENRYGKRRFARITRIAACAALVILCGTAVFGRGVGMKASSPAMMAAAEAGVIAEERLDDSISLPAAAAFTAEDYALTAESAVCEPESPAEAFFDEYLYNDALNYEELISALEGTAAELTDFDYVIALDLAQDAERGSIIFYTYGDDIYYFDDEGNCFHSSLNMTDFKQFVSNAK